MTSEPTPRDTTAQAKTVLRPGLDARTQELLRASRYSDPEDWFAVTAQTLGYGGPPVGFAALASWLTADGTVYPEAVHQVLSWWPAAAGAVVVVAVARAVAEARRGRAIRQALATPDQWVQARELVPEADELLARAQKAIRQVRASDVHREGLLDRDRNEAMFPVQEWEIATALRDYSRLLSQEPTKPQAAEVTELIASRRLPLEAGYAAILRRVTALETLAARVGEADARYAAMKQIQQVTADSDEVLDFLARTVRDDLAVAEIDGLAGEAAVVAASFTRALETAKESAVFALFFLKAS